MFHKNTVQEINSTYQQTPYGVNFTNGSNFNNRNIVTLNTQSTNFPNTCHNVVKTELNMLNYEANINVHPYTNHPFEYSTNTSVSHWNNIAYESNDTKLFKSFYNHIPNTREPYNRQKVDNSNSLPQSGIDVNQCINETSLPSDHFNNKPTTQISEIPIEQTTRTAASNYESNNQLSGSVQLSTDKIRVANFSSVLNTVLPQSTELSQNVEMLKNAVEEQENEEELPKEFGMYKWMKTNRKDEGRGGSKRTRQTYTRYQTLELTKEFQFSRYLTRRQRKELSLLVNLSEKQIKVWFQNQRMKLKKEGTPDNFTARNRVESNFSPIPECTEKNSTYNQPPAMHQYRNYYPDVNVPVNTNSMYPPKESNDTSSSYTNNRLFNSNTSFPSREPIQPNISHLPNVPSNSYTNYSYINTRNTQAPYMGPQYKHCS